VPEQYQAAKPAGSGGKSVFVSAVKMDNSRQAGGHAAADNRLAEAALAHKAAGGRDTRLDVLRALALLTIFINHVPGTIFEYITHKHFGFSDSAEAFVLVSGLAVGLAYGSKFTIGRRLPLMLKMWKRAFTLYYTHIMLTLVSLAIFCGGALYMRHCSGLMQTINIAPLLADPARGLIGLVTLGHQLGYNNILPLYMVLMLFAPLMLYMAHKNMPLLLVLSGALYLFAGFYGIAPHNYPTAGIWFLNPLSWQFLFVIGLSAAIWSKKGGALPRSPWLAAFAFGYVLLALFWVRGNLWWIDPTFGLPYNLAGFNKTFLSLPRLLHILALAYLIAVLPALGELFRTSAQHPLAVLGKYSLPIFACGTVLAMVGQVLKQANPAGGLSYDCLLIAAGITAQFAYAYYLEWLAGYRKPAAAPAAAALAAPAPEPASNSAGAAELLSPAALKA